MMNDEFFLQALKRHDGKLFGRDKELAVLQEEFNLATEESKRPRAVFVHGYSGSGKSKLIHHLFAPKLDSEGHETQNQWFFAEGKYDQQRSSRPYSALIDACRALSLHLCRRLVNEPRATTGSEEKEESPEESQSVIQAILEYLEDQLVNDFHLLIGLIPELAILFPERCVSSNNVPGSRQFDRLEAAIQTFVLGIARFQPLVLFVDDLQWADSASIDILDSLLQSEGCDGQAMLLFLGAYRDNELVGDHPLVGPVNKLQTKSCSTKLHVNDLTPGSLQSFIATLLKYEDEPERVATLSKSVHQKTRGNIFFVLEFLQMLVTTKILHFSFLNMKWEWNAVKLREQTQATENVTDLVVKRMRRLSQETALALVISAHLGNRFEAGMVDAILDHWIPQRNQLDESDRMEDDMSTSRQHYDVLLELDLDGSVSGKDHHQRRTQDLHGATITIVEPKLKSNLINKKWLHVLLKEGFIIPVQAEDGCWFRFLHDRIQQAAAELTDDEDEKKALRFRLGSLLLDLIRKEERLSSTRTTTSIIGAVDLLNSALDLVDREDTKLELAKANVDAAQVAASQSAFYIASVYLRISRTLLLQLGSTDSKASVWDSEHYDLVLDTFTRSAEMEFCCGNSAECRNLFEEVLKHRHSERDSLHVSYIMMKALGSEAKYDESIRLAYEILTEAGFTVPRNGASFEDFQEEYGKVKHAFSRLTDEDILSLPEAAASKDNSIICRMFSSLALFTWHANRPWDHNYITCVWTLMTLQQGKSEFAAHAFACQTISCVINRDNFALARRLYNLAKHPEFATRITNLEIEAGTLCATFAPSGHFFCPLTRVAEGFLRGYVSGMKTGALDWALANSGLHLITHFMAGLPLSVFETESWAFIKEMYKYESNIFRPLCQMYLQVALNLMGKASGPVQKLEGEATKEYDMKQVLEGSMIGFPCHHAWFSQLMLSYYFGDFDQAAEIALKHEEFGAADWPLLYATAQPYFRGLAYTAKVKQLKKKQRRSSILGYARLSRKGDIKFYLKKAKDQLEILELYAKNGLINTLHVFMILRADLESVSSKAKYDTVVTSYLEAIRCASRSGFRQDAALASELVSSFMQGKDKSKAKYHMETAIEFYDKWGALAKAKALKLQHRDWICNVQESVPPTEFFSSSMTLSAPLSDVKSRRVDFDSIARD